MFELLTQVLLWSLVGGAIWYVLLKVIPPLYYTWLGGIVFSALIVLIFLKPNQGGISEIWGLLAFPFSPLGIAIMLLGYALKDWHKKKAVVAPPIFAALLILFISSTPAIAYFLTQRAELGIVQAEQALKNVCQGPCTETNPPTSQQNVDAIVVLGWGTTQPALPYRTRIQLTEKGDRILYATQLYDEQRARDRTPFVLVSAGPRSDLQGEAKDISEANTIETLLLSYGIPKERIILESTGIDVRGSAEAVNKILQDRKIGNRIFLVSSALNSYRALRTFRKLGMIVIPRPTDFYTIQSGGATPKRKIRLADILPSSEALTRTTRVFQEFMLSIFYFLRGWLAPIDV
ncbi:MAG: YdcF family protein [Leptolyngbyaceae bacterium]|nr:YdcF family protein [Leptolyngbyaceae bacterium]